MNRHFQSYAALPCEPLGKPIRPEAEKPSPETQWKPVPGHPEYRERINAQGIREVSHKDHVPAPTVGLTQAESEARGDSIVTTLADVPEGATHTNGYGDFFKKLLDGGNEYWNRGTWFRGSLTWAELEDVEELVPLAPSAPTEWQSGPPPEIGFYIASRYREDDVVRFWNGYVWSLRVITGDRPASSCIDMSDRLELFGVEWRGPRLVGADWPEPQP